MLKIAAVEFYDIFNDYCGEVRRGQYEKIEYTPWRTLNGIFKDLQKAAYKPDDWFAMPLYLNIVFGKSQAETQMSIATADNSINCGNLLIPRDFVEFIYERTGRNTPVNKNNAKREDKTMNPFTENTQSNSMSDMLPAFNFGPVTGDAVRVSPYGMAIKNKDGAWVSYNAADGSVINVSGFTFDLGQMLFKVPVALNQIQKGDMVIHNRVPMYVTDVAAGGKQVSVVDIREGEVKTVMPPTNMFGFNFVTKVVSLVNLQAGNPDPNNPFGNIMPFIVMSSMFGGEGDTSGLGDMFKGDLGKMMAYSMIFGGGQNPLGNLFGGLMPQTNAPIVQTPTGIPTPEVPQYGTFCTQTPPQTN